MRPKNGVGTRVATLWPSIIYRVSNVYLSCIYRICNVYVT